MKNAKKDRKPDIVLDAPGIPQDEREKLVAKAKAARQAALVGLIPQEQADALWSEAEAACKPTEESLAMAKAAKDELVQAEKVLKAAQAAHAVDLIGEDAVAMAKEKADAAKAIYADAAKGFSMGGGGGTRYKGQMGGLDAAFAILSESGIPMNAAAITKLAIERGLWNPDGATPAATLSAALQKDVMKGDNARFFKVSAGHYAVRQ